MALVGDDCYFYYTSGCVRGMQCAFRHQPAAKNTEIVCPDWLGGACFKQTCLLRHMLMPNARVQIQCRWDTMPSGCLDSGCTYAHINKNVIIPGPSPIEVKSSTSSNVRQPLLSSPLARTSVLKFSNEIPNLQSNNSISQIVNVMPQANMVEALPGPILNPPGVINVAPPIIPLQQPLILNVPRPHLHSSILGPPPVLANSSVFPRNDFQQQVQLFKDLLAQKNKTYDSEELENGKRDKYKEKIRHKKEKKNVRKFSKDSKKKIKLSKVDEEILFGDYKDIPLERKKKKEQSDSIQNINIKSYEEILREKVFRKTMEKRREFAEDFKDLTSDERNKNKFEKQNNKKRTKAVSNVSINDNDSISKDDVIEVGIDGSPIREDLPNGNHARSPKKESKKTAPESSHDESVEIYIPDETADINISIDENDELVKELNEASHQKHTSVARSKITNVMHKNSGDKVASVSKKNKSLITDVVNKRKVIRLDKDDKSPVLNNKEDTLKSDIKIKTFEEIMQEKRKRKNMSSEPEMNTVKKILDPLHIKSVKAKTELRRSVVGTRENKDKDSKKETNDVFKVRSTLGLTSISKKNVETNLKDSNVGTVTKKIITIAKPVINGKNSEDNSIGIRSFDEIMREKQLRKQNESRNKSLGGNQVNQVSNDVKLTEKVNLDQTSKPTEKATLRQKSKPTEKINSMPTSKSSDNVGSISTSKSSDNVGSTSTCKSSDNVGSSSIYKSSEKLGSMPTTKHNDKIVVISVSKPTEKVTSMLTSKPTEKVSPMLNSKPVEKLASMFISKPSEKVTSVNHLHKQSTLSENDKEIHVKSNISSQIKNVTEKNSSTLEHIKEALDEVKRKRDEYLLSDEEFEKEINDLSSNEGEGCINDDLDDDDLIIELSEMIDGN